MKAFERLPQIPTQSLFSTSSVRSIDGFVVYDSALDRIEAGCDSSEAREFLQGQALFRCYQSRYILLPEEGAKHSPFDEFKAFYDVTRLQQLQRMRSSLEADLIQPLAHNLASQFDGYDWRNYIEDSCSLIAKAPSDAFLAFLKRTDQREHYYRNFLIQSSIDLLAEASASALGIVGQFGEEQASLFKILIDEFGYGVYPHKHSTLYRGTMKSFGLNAEYNYYWPCFDASSVLLHNVIHYLFQNPGNFFKQLGFLFIAETSYQRTTQAHCSYLNQFHSGADSRYFAEHAHIDIHHKRMIVDEVIAPLIRKFGDEFAIEIIVGAELTKFAFERFGSSLQVLSGAFQRAVNRGASASLGVPDQLLGRDSIIRSFISSAGCLGSDQSDEKAAYLISGVGCIHDKDSLREFPSDTIVRYWNHE